jgi:hypothetical protein
MTGKPPDPLGNTFPVTGRRVGKGGERLSDDRKSDPETGVPVSDEPETFSEQPGWPEVGTRKFMGMSFPPTAHPSRSLYRTDHLEDRRLFHHPPSRQNQQAVGHHVEDGLQR